MQFLLCSIGKQHFAIDAMQVVKITERMAVSKLPYVANYIDGLINNDGDVIVQLNLPRLLSIPTHVQGELIIISVNNYTMALLVDNALEKVMVDDGDINHLAATNEYEESDYIHSELTLNNRSYLVLTLEKFAHLIKPETIEDGENSFLTRNQKKNNRRAEEEFSAITFGLNNEIFALPLLNVSEIIELSVFTKIPGAPKNVVGIASLRGQPLLVLKASSLFNLEEENSNVSIQTKTNQLSKVIILSYKNGLIGLLIDRIFGIQQFTESQCKKEESVDSLVHSYLIDHDAKNGQQRVILLMNVDGLFNSEIFINIDKFIPKVKAIVAAKTITTVKVLKIVLANEICAIPIENVVRLSEVKNSIVIEGNERGIVGTVDVDGQIIPLVNINQRMNIRNNEQFKNAEKFGKIVIIEHQKQQWALCINEALALFDLDIELIDSSTHRETVSGIASYKGELISILDFDWLANA